MLCADWDSLFFVKLQLLFAFGEEYFSKMFSAVARKLELLWVARERLFSFVFKDVLSHSFLTALMEIGVVTVFFSIFCSETDAEDEGVLKIETVVFEAITPVADDEHDAAEFVVISDGKVEIAADTADCVVVVFNVTGLDNKLKTRI